MKCCIKCGGRVNRNRNCQRCGKQPPTHVTPLAVILETTRKIRNMKNFPKAQNNDHIRREYEAAGLPQEAFAEMVGYSGQAISRWLNDVDAAPKVTELAMEALQARREKDACKPCVCVVAVPVEQQAAFKSFVEALGLDYHTVK